MYINPKGSNTVFELKETSSGPFLVRITNVDFYKFNYGDIFSEQVSQNDLYLSRGNKRASTIFQKSSELTSRTCSWL